MRASLGSSVEKHWSSEVTINIISLGGMSITVVNQG